MAILFIVSRCFCELLCNIAQNIIK